MAQNRSTSESLARFLDQETFVLTVNGAIGRNRTYREGIDEPSKSQFRNSLQCWLYDRLGEYAAKPVDENRHLANIQRLSSTLSQNHADILLDGTFRIGTAQKALNLYLKYGWARGNILEPPHCPIDSIVLAKIKKCASSAECRICEEITWTKIRYVHEYMHFVEKAKARATEEGLSIARWELSIWEIATASA